MASSLDMLVIEVLRSKIVAIFQSFHLANITQGNAAFYEESNDLPASVFFEKGKEII